MATRQLNQVSFEEKITVMSLSSTYLVYAIGGVYVLGSVIGYLLMGLVVLRLIVEEPEQQQSLTSMSYLWSISMFIMLVTLLIGHANWQLGLAQTIKSTIGWAKGWALMALFIWLGANSAIRPHFVVRGACLIAIHSLFFAAISIVAYAVGIPGDLYVSPLKAIGGPGPDFFKVSLYGMNPETGAGRWQFFGPWAPSAGLIACLFLIICSLETNTKMRNWAFIGCAVICILSQSRAGMAIFMCLIPLLWSQRFFNDPRILLMVGIGIPFVLLMGQPLIEMLLDSYQQVRDARPDSTRVRNALANIALQRWQVEAFWFGHGIVERGPKMVEFMPIGSHHSWYGLLFVKGIVGLLALAIPMTITLLYLMFNATRSLFVQRAMCIVIVLFCYSFFENLEILMYLCWPAFLMIGMAFSPKKYGEYDEQF